MLNFTDDFFFKCNDIDLFFLKSRQLMEFNVDLKMMSDYQQKGSTLTEAFFEAQRNLDLSINRGVNTVTYEISSLRIMQAFSFYSWRLIEMLLNNKMCVSCI